MQNPRLLFCAAVALSLLITGCQESTLPVTSFDDAEQATTAAGKTGGDVIPGRFIVTLQDGADAAGVASAHGVAPDYVYSHVLNGFAGAMSDAARNGLLRDARVLRVEPDGVVHAIATQSNATWGLDRIDQRENALDGNYTYNATGTGVKAYIIDTGIRTTHNDFGGRAVHGYDSVDGDSDASDCNGHGTHVAGTVGGAAYGAAKAVTLVAVRVLDCSGSGTWSGVIAGMDWVTGDHAAGTPAVANLSLGGGANTSVDEAVQRMIDDGIATAVAAGNGNMGGKEQDACGYSPARVPDAMTIGATSQSDSKTSWSNYGDCVDWFAPGYQITSAWYTADDATNTISGTSMAAPHVAGVAALYLEGSPGATALAVRDALYDATTKGIVTNSRTANNHLLYSLLTSDGGGGGGGTENSAPVASFTYSCTGLDCSFDGSGSTDDGADLTYSWDYGDGATGSGVTSTHTYGADGSYSVTLTVTDTEGLQDSQTKSVSVSAGSTEGITLSANGYKVKGKMTADLTWTGATSTSVDIWRKDGSASFAVIATTANDGEHTDATNYVGGGTLTYKVCEAGTSTCSSEVAVVF